MLIHHLLDIKSPLIQAAMAGVQDHSLAVAAGCNDFSPLWWGQNGTGCRKISAQTMTEHLISRL